jgi:hypothetical protein
VAGLLTVAGRRAEATKWERRADDVRRELGLG